jgi:hexulose-6-phosphate isomerase
MVGIDGPLVEKFRLLRRLGFDGVELDSPTDAYSADEVRRARDAAGLPVHGVVFSRHWSHPLSHPDSAARARTVEDLRRAIRDAQAFGGSSVLLVPAVVRDGVSYEEAWQRSQREIRKVVPFAEDSQIQILFENVWNDFLTNAAETAKYIDQFESEAVGAYFDVGNAVRYATPVEWIRILGKRIKKLDIKEYRVAEAKRAGNPGAGFRVKLLEGDCNWPAVMDELVALDFRGWATAEIPGGGEARLREIAERMDRIFQA